MSLNRLNETYACDICKILKTKCARAVSTTSKTKCTQCKKRNLECTYYKGKGEKRGPKPKNSKDNKRKEEEEIFRTRILQLTTLSIKEYCGSSLP
ncbi:4924_t:CDS:2 [Dentiscutata erythropus]|uniref:4924_t:CDS:1 n=1 Tax=Dentiscutata erythropus TaxID=1348616 RepID=A0A9N9P443_9GLOM|nr:4924_t:CDS:2 [Dentiscutata erythropus]